METEWGVDSRKNETLVENCRHSRSELRMKTDYAQLGLNDPNPASFNEFISTVLATEAHNFSVCMYMYVCVCVWFFLNIYFTSDVVCCLLANI